MPRPVPSPASSSSSASPDGGFLCERVQQFRQRMRSRCLAAASASGAESTEAGAIPCLLQSWRRRIEAMDDEQQQSHRHHRGHRHHRRACHTAASTESSATESDESSPSSPPPACGGFPFRGPRLLHPKLERQQAACSLSGIWSGFTSSSTSSPPPSPEIYAKPRHRRHPYARCVDTAADDHGKSSATE